MRALLIPLLLLIPILVLGQVYKWTDANGKVHYSDRPVSGAEPLGVPVKKTPPAQQQPAPSQASLGPYTQFEILAPEPNATVRDAEGKVQVGLVLEPALMEGHRLQILVDEHARSAARCPGPNSINGCPSAAIRCRHRSWTAAAVGSPHPPSSASTSASQSPLRHPPGFAATLLGRSMPRTPRAFPLRPSRARGPSA